MSDRRRSSVVTLRLSPELDRIIAREARRRRRTKSAVLREAVENAFGGNERDRDPATEARRQSLLASGRASERQALQFIERVADRRGWR